MLDKIPNNGRIVDSIKQALLRTKDSKTGSFKPHPIPCGFNIHPGFEQQKGLVAVPEKAEGKPCYWSEQHDGVPGLHAMLIVGFDDDFAGKGKGALEVMNSQGGRNFGDNGFVWISYDLLNKVGTDPKDPTTNPCCVIAWDYSWKFATASFSATTFGTGAQPAWVRLEDQGQEINFKKDNRPVLIEELTKGDMLKATATINVRENFRAIGGEATSALKQVGRLKAGDDVVIEDYNTLTRGDKREVWAKVRRILH